MIGHYNSQPSLQIGNDSNQLPFETKQLPFAIARKKLCSPPHNVESLVMVRYFLKISGLVCNEMNVI